MCALERSEKGMDYFMNLDKINFILNNDEKCDVFCDNRCVWIQSVDASNEMAKVGFVDNFEERDVPIADLNL